MNQEKYWELIQKAREYGSQQDWDNCIDYYEQAFQIMINEDDLLDLGLVYLENNNSFKALQELDKVIKSDPDYYRSYYYKGIYYETMENDDEALSNYFEALNHDITDLIEKAEICFKISRIYDDKEKADEAIKFYLLSLRCNNNHYYSNLNLGSIYEQKDELDKALFYTKKALEIDATLRLASYNLGVIYGKLNNYDLAIDCYLEEISKDDFYPYAYYNLGIIYKDYKHDLKKALEYYIQALEFLKDDGSVWYNLGCCYVLLGDYSNASDCFYCAIMINESIYAFLKTDEEIKDFLDTKDCKVLQDKLKIIN